MKAYDLEDWADYLRGVTPPGLRAEMERCLQHDTDGCARDLALLGEVSDVLREDAEGPPESWTWSAKTLPFAERDTPSPPPPYHVDPSVFPPLARERSVRHEIPLSEPKRLVYRSGGFEIDLWVETPRASSPTVILGQISRGDPEPEPLAEAPIHLLEGDRAVATTLTNRFGELHLETRAEGPFCLRIMIRDRGRIDIPLPVDDF